MLPALATLFRMALPLGKPASPPAETVEGNYREQTGDNLST